MTEQCEQIRQILRGLDMGMYNSYEAMRQIADVVFSAVIGFRVKGDN